MEENNIKSQSYIKDYEKEISNVAKKSNPVIKNKLNTDPPSETWKEHTEKNNNRITYLNKLVVALLVVLVISVVGWLLDTYFFSQQRQNKFTDALIRIERDYNESLILNNKLSNKVELLENQIKYLEKGIESNQKYIEIYLIPNIGNINSNTKTNISNLSLPNP